MYLQMCVKHAYDIYKCVLTCMYMQADIQRPDLKITNLRFVIINKMHAWYCCYS